MPANKGTTLDKNPFNLSMSSSIPNAAEIMQMTFDALNNVAVVDPAIVALKNYLKPKNISMQTEAALQKADLVSKIGATADVVVTVKGTKVALKSWIKDIANVYPEGTTNYNRLLIGGSTSFYKGSRSKRLIRINALITAIGADPLLATVKGHVQTFANAFSGNTTTQTVGKATVKTDSATIKALVEDCTEGMWYVYLGLMMVYIKTPKKALAFLPMEFIYKAANEKSYTVLFPAHNKKKICIHLAKEGESYTMKNNRLVPIKIGMALTAKSPVLVWFTLLVGQTITINPTLLGNILFKYIMGENDDLLIAGDITFTINAAA